MLRTYSVCALLGVIATPALAQPPKANPGVTVIALTASAAPEPRPALRYLLLPELREINPGNAVQGYLKCFMEQNHFFFNKQSVEERERWHSAPLNELPDLKGYGGTALRQADYAARLEHADWQVLHKLRTEGFNLLLPEVQQIRMLAGALRVRLRGAIKDRRFDDAIAGAKTMLAMSRHLSEHPTLIADLVAMALANLAVGPLEEMIQQPGCPNLYWAFTELPHPFIDLRKALEGERILFSVDLPSPDNPEPLSEAQLEKMLTKIDSYLAGVGAKIDGKASEQIRANARDAKELAAAREALTTRGLTAEQLRRLSPLQVAFMYETHLHEVYRDEVMKWAVLPYWQAEPAFAKAQEELKRIRAGAKGPRAAVELVPAMTKVHQAQNRVEQRFGLLRCVEALRLYAASHEGKLPARLEDVEVPLPVDPVTAKAFAYELKGDTAIIRGMPPKGLEKAEWANVHYHLTIRR